MPLGNGLQSLIPPKSVNSPKYSKTLKTDLSDEERTKNVLYIKISKIKPNPHQPRKNFEPSRLRELADSIREHGIIQPLVVNTIGDEYQLIAGERRLQAAKIVGLSEVPAIIRDSSEQEKLELALVENLQRDNLNPIEKAYAFKKLIDEFNFIQENVAKRIGRSRETVANTLRLLELPAEIQRAILNNKITEGHGRAILKLSDIEKQLLLFREIVNKKLSVRQAEEIAKDILGSALVKTKTKRRNDPYLADFESKLSNALGTRVKLSKKGKKGKIIIDFFSPEELNSIIKKICKK